MWNGAKTWFVLSMSTIIWMSVGSDLLSCDGSIDLKNPRTKTNCSGMLIYYNNKRKIVSIDCNGSTLDCPKLIKCSQSIYGFPSQLNTLQLRKCAVNSSLHCPGWKSTIIRKLCLVEHPSRVEDAVEGLTELESLLIYMSDKLKSVPVESLKILPTLKFLRMDGDGLRDLPPHAFYDADNPTSIGENLTFVSIAQNNITSLQGDVFFGLHKLNNISICDNHMRQVDVHVFRGLGSLLRVEFADEFISLPPGIFQHTPLLSVLTVSRNREELRLDEGVISSLAYLEELTIRGTKKLILGPKALSHLPLLQTLDLSESNITELPGDVFLNSSAITSLNLMDNRISHLPQTIFSGLTKLETLRISNNSLESVNKYLFKYLTEIKEIYLDQNYIKTLPDGLFSLSNLVELSLAKNRIAIVSEHAFNTSSLTSLSLSDNKLTWNCKTQGNDEDIIVSSVLANLTKLTSLDLSYNQISSICSDWRNSMTYLQTLDLSNNRLEKLSSEDLNFQSGNLKVNFQHNIITTININPHKTRANDKHLEFKIGSNPYNCDCELYDFLKSLANSTDFTDAKYKNNDYRSLDKNIFDLTDAQCNQPKPLENASLIVIANQKRLDSLTCTVHGFESCDCLFRPNKHRLECSCNELLNLSLLEPPFDKTIAMKLKLLKLQPDLTGLPSFVTELDLSSLELKSIPDLPPTVRELDLRNNSLKVIPLEILNMNLTLILEKNQLECDCGGTDNVRNIQTYKRKILKYNELLCSDGSHVKGKTPESLCQLFYAASIGSSCIIAGIIIAIAIVLMYKYLPQVQVLLFNIGLERFVDKEWLDSGKKYDIFLSYTMRASEDKHFVTNILLPKLEELNYTICEHTRDFEIGHSIPDQICTSVANSKRTLFVISNTFIQNSVWVLEEFNATILQGEIDKRNRAVIIVLGDVDLSKAPMVIKRHIALNTYIKWDAVDESFWKRLQNALPKKLTVKEIKKRQNAVKAVKALGGGRNTVVNDDGRLVIAIPDKVVNATAEPIQLGALSGVNV